MDYFLRRGKLRREQNRSTDCALEKPITGVGEINGPRSGSSDELLANELNTKPMGGMEGHLRGLNHPGVERESPCKNTNTLTGTVNMQDLKHPQFRKGDRKEYGGRHRKKVAQSSHT